MPKLRLQATLCKMSVAYGLILLLLAGCNLASDEQDERPGVTDTPAPILQTPFPTRTPARQPTATALPLDNPIPAITLQSQGGGATGSGGGSAPTLIPLATATAAVTFPPPETARDRFDVEAGAGQTIVVSYSVTLTAPGEIFIYVRDPQGDVIDGLRIDASAEDDLEVQAPVSGTYTVLVPFDRLPGSYSLSYSLR